MLDDIARIASLCLALAGVETLHGIARTVLLVPRIGKARARKVGIVIIPKTASSPDAIPTTTRFASGMNTGELHK